MSPRILASLLAVTLASCSTPDDFAVLVPTAPTVLAKIETLKPEVSTKANAIALLGRPQHTMRMPDGTELLQWIEQKAGVVEHGTVLFRSDGVMDQVEEPNG